MVGGVAVSALLDPELSARMSAPDRSRSVEPSGWFCVGLSEEMPAGTTAPLRFFGHAHVLARSDAGELTLRPASAQADRQAFVAGVGRARAATGPTEPRVVERGGLIMVWHHPSGLGPEWPLPSWDESGFSALRSVHSRFAAHPQEAGENTVDLSHFSTVHGYKDVHVAKPVEVVGQRMSITYRMTRSVPGTSLSIPVQFAVDVWGVGLSLVTFGVMDMPFEARLLLLSTPTDPGRIELRAATQVRLRGGLLPDAVAPWVRDVANRFVLHAVRQDVARDEAPWAAREPTPRPVAATDGLTREQYRDYVRQFYP